MLLSQRAPLFLISFQTSNAAAATLASCLGIDFSSAFVKNRYGRFTAGRCITLTESALVYRTFILPGQDARKKGIRRKLSAIESEFKGKSVCIVDDSIVRGNTSREIVRVFQSFNHTLYPESNAVANEPRCKWPERLVLFV